MKSLRRRAPQRRSSSAIPRRDEYSLSIAPGGQKVIHDTFPFGETHVYRKEEGRWVETVADVPGVVDASWYLLAGEERFDASYEVGSYNTEEATVTEVFDPGVE